MNEPIISPWIFYIADVLGGLCRLSVVLLLVSLTGAAILWAAYYSNMNDMKDDVRRVYMFDLEDALKSETISRERLDEIANTLQSAMLPVVETLRWAKRATVLLIISIVLTLFIPSKDTFYKMIIAHYITPNTVNKVLNTGKSLHDGLKKDIIDLIDHIKTGGKNDTEGKNTEGN